MPLKTITTLKEQAGQRFTELETPTFNYGNGFALNIAIDWKKVFAEMRKAEDAEIIVDAAAKDKVKICKLSESGEDFMSKYTQRLVSASENKLLALHYATTPDATVIIISKNTIIENPIVINTKTKVTASAETIIIIAEEGTSATIIEQATSTEEAYYHSQILQVYVHPRANLTYCTVHDEKAVTHSFATKRAEVLHNASIHWFDVVIGEGFTQVQLRSHLREAGAEAQQYQVIVGSDIQQCDINSDAFHEKSNTKSIMLAKGILSDKARAMHRGTIRVEKNARGCHGHQRSDMLLIGDEARCNAIPILEVENDDVSCSHGTSIGQIDEEQLYYLLSRGLDEKEAKRLLVSGFVEPLLQKVSNEKTREKLRDIIQPKIEK